MDNYDKKLSTVFFRFVIKNNDKNWHEIISEKVRKNRKSFRLNFARKNRKKSGRFWHFDLEI